MGRHASAPRVGREGCDTARVGEVPNWPYCATQRLSEVTQNAPPITSEVAADPNSANVPMSRWSTNGHGSPETLAASHGVSGDGLVVLRTMDEPSSAERAAGLTVGERS